jgi:hypothetical protein
MSEQLTFEQWLLALDEAQARAGSMPETTDDFLTRAEWQEKLGISLIKTLRWLHDGVNNGWIQVGKARRTNLCGSLYMKSAYRIIQPVVQAPSGKRKRNQKSTIRDAARSS